MRPPPIMVAAPSMQGAAAVATYDIGLRPQWWDFVSDPWRAFRGRREAPLVIAMLDGYPFDYRYWGLVNDAIYTGQARCLPDDWNAGLVFDHDHVTTQRPFVGPRCGDCGGRLDSHYSYGVDIALQLRRGHPLDYIQGSNR